VQRLAGAIIGAAVAAGFVLTVDNKVAAQLVIVLLIALAESINLVNYAFYFAANSAAVLIAVDLPHPSNLADEEQRVLFTFIGVGIGVLVLFLANLLGKRRQSGAQPASTG
jgi:uncharacterized membrane protein YgaE (UPF0421/DUF939 family)